MGLGRVSSERVRELMGCKETINDNIEIKQLLLHENSKKNARELTIWNYSRLGTDRKKETRNQDSYEKESGRTRMLEKKSGNRITLSGAIKSIGWWQKAYLASCELWGHSPNASGVCELSFFHRSMLCTFLWRGFQSLVCHLPLGRGECPSKIDLAAKNHGLI